MYAHRVCAWCLEKSGEGIESSGTTDTDSCGSPCGFWELKLSPLQEKPVLLVGSSAAFQQDF